MADDGCGTMIDCGTCKSPKVCGSKHANRCDNPPG
jgi:hypothetical protein